MEDYNSESYDKDSLEYIMKFLNPIIEITIIFIFLRLLTLLYWIKF